MKKRLYQLTGKKSLLKDFETCMKGSVSKYRELIDYAQQHYRGGTPTFHALTWEQTTHEMRVKLDHDLQMKWLKGPGP